MAATYDLTTSIGKVRLLISDTDVTDAQFTDEEITEFLTMASNSVNLAAALALEAWAASLTGSAESEKIGDYSYTKKQASNKLALAEQYRKAEAETPVLEWAEIDLTRGSGITAEED